MSRFAYERAIRESGLPAPARHIALTLATWADVNTCVIPERFMPSLAKLAETTGLGKSTVARYLPVLEEDGWIHRRQRKGKSPTHNEVTHTTLTVPAEARTGEDETEEVVPERDKGGATAGQEVVPERDKGRPGAGHKSSRSSGSTHQSPRAGASEDRTGPASGRRDGRTTSTSITDALDAAADAARQELERATGREITTTWARKVALGILDAAGGPVDRPAGYVRAAIRNEIDASRFLPTSTAASNASEAFVPEPQEETEPARPALTLHNGTGRRPRRADAPSQPPLLSSVVTDYLDDAPATGPSADQVRSHAAAIRATLAAQRASGDTQ
ncbi:helix-turn-helix domain-containing protein [Nocardiopsis synnemataformans]|uniref:helix-turn-helix domain-containing protein n=1 Tax=Nocardiopsis synnemataformans TaxID=61305 RepID=UPI003EBB6373